MRGWCDGRVRTQHGSWTSRPQYASPRKTEYDHLLKPHHTQPLLLCQGLYWGPSVLWRSCPGSRKGIRPVKTERWGAGVIICLERGVDLHMAQLMPLPLTVSCFSEIQTGFTFLVPAHPGSPWQKAVKRVCVCVCLHLLMLFKRQPLLPACFFYFYANKRWWTMLTKRLTYLLPPSVAGCPWLRADSDDRLQPIRSLWCIRKVGGRINNGERCAENYNKWHNKFIFLNTISVSVISNHNSFGVLFDKIAYVYFIWKMYLYFSIGNGQPGEPALCQLYRHTLVP